MIWFRNPEDNLPRGVNDALVGASEALDKLGVRYAIIGGVAAAAHGYLRSTADVDFLVGPDAFEGTVIITHLPGMPINVGGVPIDYIPIMEGEEFLDKELTGETISLPAFIYLKLKAGRRKDKDDVVHVIEAGGDDVEVRKYLGQHAPHLLPPFDRLMEEL